MDGGDFRIHVELLMFRWISFWLLTGGLFYFFVFISEKRLVNFEKHSDFPLFFLLMIVLLFSFSLLISVMIADFLNL